MSEDFHKLIIAFIILGVGASVVVMVGVNVSRSMQSSVAGVQNRGSVSVTLDLLVDRESIDWGTLFPSENKNEVVTVTNTGNAPQTLSLSTGNWSSVEAQSFLSLSWNYSGVDVQPQHSVPLTFTLQVSPDVENVTDFSFDITITGA